MDAEEERESGSEISGDSQGSDESDERKSSGMEETPDEDEDDDDDYDEEVIYTSVELDSSVLPVSKSELLDDDTELMLLRLPVHCLDSKLVGKTIEIDDDRQDGGLFPNERAGAVEGGYYFRDCDSAEAKGLRAAFVFNGDDDDRTPQLHFGT